MRYLNYLLALGTLLSCTETLAFSTPAKKNAPFFSRRDLSIHSTSDDVEETIISRKKIAVTGATGRTGSLVVKKLLEQDSCSIVAMVRDVDKAKTMFDDEGTDKLSIVTCDLTSEEDIGSKLSDCDALIWCATGFSQAPTDDIIEKIRRFFNIAISPKNSIDLVGLSAIGRFFAKKENPSNGPQVVVCSSAGVTRPSWSEEKKEKFKGCSDIPIVRLNPFGILDTKFESEKELRKTGANYCIVRPCGLNDDWPTSLRPILTQGDVGVGRINRGDVAKILVDVLSYPEAAYKTFETFTLNSYQPAPSMDNILSQLISDPKGESDGYIPSDAVLVSTYMVAQQLLPGERQEANQLAMGQTYEQLDKDEVGRLGVRGEEDAQAAAPKPSS